MRFPASRGARSGSARRFIRYLLLFIFGFVLFLPSKVHAQTPTTTSNTSSTTSSFNVPQMDANVPRNQHTYAQAVTIEVLSSVHCILTGIDPINPSQGCLGINPESRKIGLSKPTLDANGRPEVSGMAGFATGLITSTFQPVASTTIYTQYVSDKFGIVDKAHAAGAPCDPVKSGYGFCGLMPVFELWVTVRNISYALLILATMFIGLGIMLRVKIDPRTVMTIQNQIPKVIVSIVLITFSYAISALMVDLMWTTTYAGTYLLTSKHNPPVGNCTDKRTGEIETLSRKALATLLQTPITYFNQVFARCSGEDNIGPLTQNDRDGGFHVLTIDIANNAGETIGNVARSLVFDDDDLNTNCGGFDKFKHPIKCAKKVAINSLTVIISAVVTIIIFTVLVINLFKIWFNLLKAFIYALVYVILGPIIIVFGLLPTKPMGFENWIRRLFINIAVFPITVFLLVAARLLMDLYNNNSPSQFIPPLIGNPSTTNFGSLMAFGVILIAPTIQTILRDKMGVKNIGTPGIVGAGVAAGAAVIGAPVNRAMKHLNRSDHRTGDYGMLAKLKQRTGEGVIGAGTKIPFIKGRAKRALADRVSLRTSGYSRRRNDDGTANESGGSAGGSGGGTGATGGTGTAGRSRRTWNPVSRIRNRRRGGRTT